MVFLHFVDNFSFQLHLSSPLICSRNHFRKSILTITLPPFDLYKFYYIDFVLISLVYWHFKKKKNFHWFTVLNLYDSIQRWCYLGASPEIKSISVSSHGMIYWGNVNEWYDQMHTTTLHFLVYNNFWSSRYITVLHFILWTKMITILLPIFKCTDFDWKYNKILMKLHYCVS